MLVDPPGLSVWAVKRRTHPWIIWINVYFLIQTLDCHVNRWISVKSHVSNFLKNVAHQVSFFSPDWFDTQRKKICSGNHNNSDQRRRGLWDLGFPSWSSGGPRCLLPVGPVEPWMKKLEEKWQWIWVRTGLSSWPLTKKWWTASRTRTGELFLTDVCLLTSLPSVTKLS